MLQEYVTHVRILSHIPYEYFTLSELRPKGCAANCLSLSLSPQRTSRCLQSEGQQWTLICRNLKPPLPPCPFRWAGLKRQTRQLATYVPASSSRWILRSSSPSPALKHHGGFDDPACKKYCEEETERRSKTMTKCLALWTNKIL